MKKLLFSVDIEKDKAKRGFAFLPTIGGGTIDSFFSNL